MLRGDVGAAENNSRFFPAEPVGELQRRGERGGARGLREAAGFSQEKPYRVVHLLLAHEYKLIEALSQHPLGQLESAARGEAFGFRRHRSFDQLSPGLAALPIEHGIMNVVLTVPENLIAPVGRRLRHSW